MNLKFSQSATKYPTKSQQFNQFYLQMKERALNPSFKQKSSHDKKSRVIGILDQACK